MSKRFRLKNGTILLSTEAPGGLYNSEQLKKIAAICDKEMAIVKATEDQRLALFVKEEDSGKISLQLQELGLGVRDYQGGLHQPVTCIGDLCPDHEQDALGTAMELTQTLEGISLETKLKIGINGCYQCCVPCHTFDISVVGDTNGYRISLGGKTEQLPEMATFMAEGVPASEIVTMIADIVALYKTNAEDDESLGDVIERVGATDFIKTLAPYSQDAAGAIDDVLGGDDSASDDDSLATDPSDDAFDATSGAENDSTEALADSDNDPDSELAETPQSEALDPSEDDNPNVDAGSSELADHEQTDPEIDNLSADGLELESDPELSLTDDAVMVSEDLEPDLALDENEQTEGFSESEAQESEAELETSQLDDELAPATELDTGDLEENSDLDTEDLGESETLEAETVDQGAGLEAEDLAESSELETEDLTEASDLEEEDLAESSELETEDLAESSELETEDLAESSELETEDLAETSDLEEEGLTESSELDTEDLDSSESLETESMDEGADLENEDDMTSMDASETTAEEESDEGFNDINEDVFSDSDSDDMELEHSDDGGGELVLNEEGDIADSDDFGQEPRPENPVSNEEADDSDPTNTIELAEEDEAELQAMAPEELDDSSMEMTEDDVSRITPAGEASSTPLPATTATQRPATTPSRNIGNDSMRFAGLDLLDGSRVLLRLSSGATITVDLNDFDQDTKEFSLGPKSCRLSRTADGVTVSYDGIEFFYPIDSYAAA